MCDINSFASAYGSYAAGSAAQIDANSKGMLERAQLESAAVLVQAEARGEEIALRKSYNEQFGENIAAMAISGLDPESFSGVTEGNKKDLRANIETLSRGADRKTANLMAQGAMAEMSAQMEGKAAMYSGMLKAIGTLSDGAKAYADNNTGQGFGQYFARSMGFGEGGIGTSFFKAKG